MKIFLLLSIFLCICSVNTVNTLETPALLLNNGYHMPIVGLGTLRSGNETFDAIRYAIAAGYRHIDTSLDYGTEKEIGRALKQLFSEGVVKREQLFVVSKLEDYDHDYERVFRGINESLSNLELDYLDLYLIHRPRSAVDLAETWAGMEHVHSLGLTKSIGVSQFNESHIDHILMNATVRPVTNQVQCSPYNNQRKLLVYLNQQNITMTAFSPLGRANETLFSEPKIVSIADRLNVTVAQVMLRFQIERNIIVIPKSTSKQHIEDNINLFEFQLSAQDMQDLYSLNQV